MINYLLTFILFLIYLHQISFLSYFLQLKEYRFDRFYSQFKSEPLKFFLQMFDLRIWYRPRPTIRSLLTFLVLLSFYFLFNFHSFYLSLIFLFPINALFSLFFLIPKTILITQAKTKLSQTKGIKIGITGSFGKSFTKELVSWVLEGFYKTVKTQKNNNTLIGIAKNILSWPSNFDYAVIEMAAYKRGEIAQICRLVNPDIGIITGLGDQHLDLFGSLANIKKAKYELIDSLSPGSFRLINMNKFPEIKNIKQHKDSISFQYKNTPFTVPAIGPLLLSNFYLTIKLCHHLGLSLPQISQRLSRFPNHLAYPKLIKTKKFLVVDDTHNSSLESFQNLISYAASYPTHQKILLSNGIIELGQAESKNYQLLSPSIKIFDHILTSNPRFHQAIKVQNNSVLAKNPDNFYQLLTDLLKTPKPFIVFAKGRLYPSIYQFLNIHV